jgi:hypothetical protein
VKRPAPPIRHHGYELAGETDLDVALAAAGVAVVVTDDRE